MQQIGIHTGPSALQLSHTRAAVTMKLSLAVYIALLLSHHDCRLKRSKPVRTKSG
jgi:hypothetical protein